MVISLKNILVDKSYTDGGYALFDIADKAISGGHNIVLDMDGVSSVPTLFLNTSFGDLIEKYGIEKIKKMFSFNNINRFQLEKIQKYFDDFRALCESSKA